VRDRRSLRPGTRAPAGGGPAGGSLLRGRSHDRRRTDVAAGGVARRAIAPPAFALTALLLAAVLACAGLPRSGAAGAAPRAADAPRVRLETDLGAIVVEVYPDRAPASAANFLRYVEEGRFDGAAFYRVVTPGNQPDNPVKIEVIQGGLGFADDHPRRLPPIPHETTAATGLAHRDGTLSMARLEPGTASGEFFLCVGDQPELDFGGRRNPDGQGFAAFGRVVEGMEVVRRIHRLPADGQMLVEPVAIRRAVPLAE
jgi:peptidyl-prolyl cis-trans isomerase A (cyclophilin A)